MQLYIDFFLFDGETGFTHHLSFRLPSAVIRHSLRVKIRLLWNPNRNHMDGSLGIEWGDPTSAEEDLEWIDEEFMVEREVP